MAPASSRRMAWRLAAALQCTTFTQALTARAASSLAAWAFTEEGVLKLRTSRNARLEAFFQAASDGRGTRVWIDIPGELRFPRRLAGRGAVREIRLGKPRAGATRLVVEFRPDVDLNPNDLRLREPLRTVGNWCSQACPFATTCGFLSSIAISSVPEQIC